MAELDSKSGIGLIERKRQGLGRPDLIYLKNFIAVQEDISQKEEKQEQGEVLPLQSGKEMPLITDAEDSFQTGKSCINAERQWEETPEWYCFIIAEW